MLLQPEPSVTQLVLMKTVPKWIKKRPHFHWKESLTKTVTKKHHWTFQNVPTKMPNGQFYPWFIPNRVMIRVQDPEPMCIMEDENKTAAECRAWKHMGSVSTMCSITAMCICADLWRQWWMQWSKHAHHVNFANEMGNRVKCGSKKDEAKCGSLQS